MHNKGGPEKAGGFCAARRGQKQVRSFFCAVRKSHEKGQVVIALKKQLDKHINEHLKAQEKGHRQEVGIRANCGKQRKTSTHTKRERALNERNKND